MFNDLVVGFFTLFSWLVLIAGGLLALYVLLNAFLQIVARKPARVPHHDVVFAASEPQEKAPESRESGHRR
jgi:hypothetical protein